MNLVLESKPLPLRMDTDGVIRVGHTRVTLDTVIGAFKNGDTAEQIAQDYPVLDLVDIDAVIACYLYQPETMDTYLAEQMEEGQQRRVQMEARFDPQGIRERLLARRHQEDKADPARIQRIREVMPQALVALGHRIAVRTTLPTRVAYLDTPRLLERLTSGTRPSIWRKRSACGMRSNFSEHRARQKKEWCSKNGA